MKKLYEPLDLSRRDSVDTAKTPSSLYSDRTTSPLDISSYPESFQDTSTSHSDERQDTPSPDFAYFDSDHFRQSTYMIEAAALQKRISQGAPFAKHDDSLNEGDGKSETPFNAYSENPLSPSTSLSSNLETSDKFRLYRLEMLNQIQEMRGGQPTKSNPKMRRSGHTQQNRSVADSDGNTNHSDSSGSGIRDQAYYERREKNNAAAKRSRDRRRIKEDEIAIRATFLENENLQHKADLAKAQKVVAALKMKLAMVRAKLAIYCTPDCPFTIPA